MPVRQHPSLGGILLPIREPALGAGLFLAVERHLGYRRLEKRDDGHRVGIRGFSVVFHTCARWGAARRQRVFTRYAWLTRVSCRRGRAGQSMAWHGRAVWLSSDALGPDIAHDASQSRPGQIIAHIGVLMPSRTLPRSRPVHLLRYTRHRIPCAS